MLDPIARTHNAIQGASATADTPPTISLPQFLQLLRRRKLTIIMTVLAMLSLGLIHLSTAPVLYSASATMNLDVKRSSVILNTLGEVPADEGEIESQIEFIRSERIAHVVVQKLGLINDPEFISNNSWLQSSILAFRGYLTQLWAEKEQSVWSDEDVLRAVTAAFRSQVRVARVGRSYTVDISFTSLSPSRAAQAANAIADAYIAEQIDAKMRAAKRAGEWLQGRTAELKEQASSAYQAVQDFKLRNNIIVDDGGQLSTDRELTELTMSLARTRAETSQAGARLERIQLILGSRGKSEIGLDPTVTDALNNPIITRLRQQYLDAQRQANELVNRFGESHASVAGLRSQMAGLERAIWEEVQRIAETYKSEVEIAQERERSIEARVTEVFQKASSTRQAQVHLRELESASNTLRTVYQEFLNKYTQTVQQQSFPSTEARIITPASEPYWKSSPRVGLTIAFALSSGLLLGGAAAIAREQFDNTIKTPQQVEQISGLTCFGILPSITMDRYQRTILKLRRHRKTDRSAAGLSVLRNEAQSSLIDETLRNTKVNIDLYGIAQGAKVIAVASAQTGEGKTAVAVRLAATLAESGHRTLLVDLDFRNPSLTKLLQPDGNVGLIEILTGAVSDCDQVIVTTEYGFGFVPGSPGARQIVLSPDTLGAGPLERLVEELKQRFDFIVLSCPSVLSISDWRASVQLSDCMILVHEWGKSTFHELERAASILSEISDRTLGILISKSR